MISIEKVNRGEVSQICFDSLTRDFSCIVRRGRKYLGGVAKLF